MLFRPYQQSAVPGSGTGTHVDHIITNAAPLPFPIEARLDQTGERVTLMQTCDWKGQSPANIGVDRQGKQFLATFDELTVTDHRVLPNPAVDAIRHTMGRQPADSGR
jgi:hypothetical protein